MMLYSLKTFAYIEFTRLAKGWLFWAALVITIIVPLYVDSPVQGGQVKPGLAAAYSYGYGTVLALSFLVPFLISTMFFYDERTEMLKVYFTQPVKPAVYAFGKYLGQFMLLLFIEGIGALVYLFMPVLQGSKPYVPGNFIGVWAIYVLPALLYFSAFCYMILVLLKTPLVTVMLPVFLALLSSRLPDRVDYLFRGRTLTSLMKGNSTEFLNPALFTQNRLITLGLGMIFLAIGVCCYSPRRFMRR